VRPGAVKPAPVKPAPVKTTPVKTTPVKTTPVKPPVKPAVKPTPIKPLAFKPLAVNPLPVKRPAATPRPAAAVSEKANPLGPGFLGVGKWQNLFFGVLVFEGGFVAGGAVLP
jgi:hypothetical protein